jgi:hypothetical protein
MVFKLKPESLSIARPRVTPHPDQAAALQRRMEALAYHPQNGFHRDLRQGRQGRVVWVLGDRLG